MTSKKGKIVSLGFSTIFNRVSNMQFLIKPFYQANFRDNMRSNFDLKTFVTGVLGPFYKT